MTTSNVCEINDCDRKEENIKHEIVKTNTENTSKLDVNKSELKNIQKKKKKNIEDDDTISIDGAIQKVVNTIFDKIIKDNEKSPWLFSNYGKIIMYNNVNMCIEQDVKRKLEDKLLYRYTMTKNENIITSIPSSIMSNLKSRLVNELPKVKLIIDHPVIFKDGRISEKIGYDSKNEIIILPNALLDLGENFNYNPSYDEMRESVDYIQENLFNDFVFLGESSLANTWAALLHPMIRPLLFEKNKPFYLIQATDPCSGKTYLTKAVTMIHDVNVEDKFVALNLNQAELHKTLHSQMLNGDYFMIFDNLNENTKLQSSTLASMLTNKTTNIRELNTSKSNKITVDNTIVANSNGIKLSSELKRRCIVVHIDKVLKKHSTYKHPDYIGYLKENRNEILRNLTTILLYCYNENKFEYEYDNILPSFEHYSKIIGSILKTIEIDGFLSNIGDYDNELDAFVLFVEIWYSVYMEQPVRTSALVELYNEFTDEEINSRKLGHLLKDRQNRIIDDRYRFSASKKQNANMYTLEKIA